MDNDYVKLTRTVRDADNGVFEIDVYSLCKLIDALSNGNLLNYLNYFVIDNNQSHMKGVGVDPALSIERISRYMSIRLKPSDAQKIFGRVNLVSSKDYEYFFLRSKEFDNDNTSKEIRRYIRENFKIEDGKLARLSGKKFINV